MCVCVYTQTYICNVVYVYTCTLTSFSNGGSACLTPVYLCSTLTVKYWKQFKYTSIGKQQKRG